MSERAPLVSVIVPTFERREAVGRAARSVLAQTFRDFELLVVDDGSRDGTREAIGALGGLVHYLWQPNRGVAAARNAGLRRARGELIAFLDSDDRWLPEHLAVIVALMSRHPEAVLASTSPGYSRRGRAPVERSWTVEPLPAMITRPIAGFVSSTAVRRADVEALGGFDESLPTFEDTDLWLRLALRGPFALLPRRTALIGRTEGSLSLTAARDASHLAAVGRSLRRLEDRVGEPRVAAQVRGLLAFIEALGDLDAGNGGTVEDKVRFACAALPQLSEDWGAGLYTLGLLTSTQAPAARLRHLRTLASAWPDRRSPMAAALHARAALAALRLGQPAEAARLMRRAPARPLLGVVADHGAHAARCWATALGDTLFTCKRD